MISLTLACLAAVTVLSSGEKRGTEYIKKPEYRILKQQAQSDSEGPTSFSHFTLDHIPHQPSVSGHPHQPAKIPLFRVPVAVEVPKSVPVALVSPLPYYVEKPVHVPVKEFPVITKVPVHYLSSGLHQYQAPEYHYHDNTYPQLQPYYKQYHALR